MLLAAERYDEALAAISEWLPSFADTRDPDLLVSVFWAAALASLGSGRLDEARRYAMLAEEANGRLTPHHAVHGVALRLMVEELGGRWSAVLALNEEARERVAANVATPCVFNPRSLLVCAVASVEAGQGEEARQLEAAADALGMEGYGLSIDAPRVRLALLRGDLETVRRSLAPPPTVMSFTRVGGLAVRLDGLAALHDRGRIEEEAPPFLLPNTYLEPFALRALGLVRDDDRLVAKALARFRAMGLDWHAAQTSALAGR